MTQQSESVSGLPDNNHEIRSFLEMNADHLSTMEVLSYFKANYGLDEKSSFRVISEYFLDVTKSKNLLN
jgi:hypothetical protein